MGEITIRQPQVITDVVRNPTYNYNPALFWDGDQANAKCRFSLLTRVRLLSPKDLSLSRPAEFSFY